MPLCKGNYENGPKVGVFSFPKDENLKAQWIRGIRRQDFSPTQSSKVSKSITYITSVLHFKIESALNNIQSIRS